MNKIVTFLLLLFTITSLAQKRIVKELLVSQSIETIYIDLNKVFSVSLQTSKDSVVKVETMSEGEYANNFVFQDKIENNSMLLSGSVFIGLAYPQDKLSAHKVHAIEVKLIVPENKQVVLTSDIANVNIEGVYESIFLNLYSGDVNAKSLKANTTIQTVSGDISISLSKGNTSCYSKYGKVTEDRIPEGILYYTLKSLKGNINLHKVR